MTKRTAFTPELGWHKPSGSSNGLCLLLLLPLLLGVLLHPTFLRPRFAVPPPSLSAAILVTGASSGIGRHAAEELRGLGFLVYGTYRNADDRKSLLRSGVVPVEMEVTSRASIDTASSFVSRDLEARGASLFALINNAGVGAEGPLEVLPVSEVRFIFSVNVFGLLDVTQSFLPLLRAGSSLHGSARVVNVGSLAGITSQKLNGAYHASKWSVEALTDSLRQELRPQGIAVSVLEPGAVESGIAGKLLEKNEGMYGAMGAEMRALYGGMIEVRERQVGKAGTLASPRQVTTDAILHAVTSGQPQERYVVANVCGVPAKVVAFLAWLFPTYVQDRVLEIGEMMS